MAAVTAYIRDDAFHVGAYLVRGANGSHLAAKVRPFFQYTENYPYLMYIDHDRWPIRLW